MQQPLTMPSDMDLLYRNMTAELDQLKKSEDLSVLMLSEKCIVIVKKTIDELKDQISKYPFSDLQEEILFFKTIKPRFYCLLIYYIKIYHTEINRPVGTKAVQERYLRKELRKLKHFFENNREFYHYWRSGATFQDAPYFLRHKQELSLSLNSYYFDLDPHFSTSHDPKVARLLANELLKEFLENELALLRSKQMAATDEPLFKIKTTLSVAQLACLLRLFVEEKLMSNPNQTELINFFACHFTSLKQEQISGSSLRSKYYNIEGSSTEAVKDLLFQLLNRLKKL
jgi:hypothetical protein